MKRAVVPLVLLGLMAALGHADEVKTSKSAQTLLFVRTSPIGARVLLDGRLLGSSDDVFHVEPGVRKIAVQMEGYVPIDETVNIPAGEVTRVELKLSPRAASQPEPSTLEGGRPTAVRTVESAEDRLEFDVKERATGGQQHLEFDVKEWATEGQRKMVWDEIRAQGTKVFRIGSADKGPAELVPAPAVRYIDQFHGIIEGTMWVYSAKGRPVAVQKVERYRPGLPTYLYGLFSLSEGLIEARWPGEPGWSSTRPGVELRGLPGGLKPATTEAGRLLQFKETVRRFSVTETEMGIAGEEMSPLPGPVHRYRDPDSGLQDGAIFAFAAHGTNPDFLVLIELRGPDLGRATWNYGPVRATGSQLKLHLDGKEVWWVSGEFGARKRFDTWLYFYRNEQEQSPSAGLKEGEPAPIPGLEAIDPAYSPCLTPDLRTIVYASMLDRVTDYDLYISTRDDVSKPFGRPKIIKSCQSREFEAFPTLSPDGLELMFVRGFNEPRFYRSRRTRVSDDFGEPAVWPVKEHGIARPYLQRPQFIDQLHLTFCVANLADDARTIFTAERQDVNSAFGRLQKVRMTDARPIYFFFCENGLRAYCHLPDGVFVSCRRAKSDPYGPPVRILDPARTGPMDGPFWIAPQEDVIFYVSTGPGKKPDLGPDDKGRKLWMLRF